MLCPHCGNTGFHPIHREPFYGVDTDAHSWFICWCDECGSVYFECVIKRYGGLPDKVEFWSSRFDGDTEAPDIQIK